MSITVNTNMQALRIQTNLNKATNKMNTAMERMSSGSKINSAKDDAAGLAVATKLSTTISSSKVASNNVAIGSNLLDTAEGTLNVVTQNLQRVRDLTEQASNGTYSTSDLTAIGAEVDARLKEVDSLAAGTTFNGIKLFNDATAGTSGITLQIGTASSDSLVLSSTIFGSVGEAAALTGITSATSGITSGNNALAASFLTAIDTQLDNITKRVTSIGAAQNQLEAVSDGLTVQQTNLTAARSTIKDADVAQESASYVQNQILQQASSSLLVQANSAPQIALTLIKG